MKRGFTLVELSIVLVIIGLLIGGILTAQSMISSVKVLRVSKDLGQYEIAYNMFRMNFKSIPGDSVYFTPNGNQNTVLDGAACGVAPYSGREEDQVFAHIAAAGMIKGNYVAYQPASCGGTHNNSRLSASLMDIVSPSFEMDGAAATQLGLARSPIYARKPSANPSIFYYEFYLGRDATLALLSKMGNPAAAPNGGVITRDGLEVIACYDVDWDSGFECKSEGTVIGQLSYALGGY